MTRVLVYHRNGLFRDCLVSYLSKSLGFESQSMDHNRVERFDGLRHETDADIVLLDLNLPDSLALEIVRSVKQNCPRTKVIILVPDEHQGLLDCIAAGVQGCVLERGSMVELDHAIQRALRGETVCSPEFAATMFSELSRVSTGISWQIPISVSRTRLTVREHEVIELIAKRNSNKQIARELCVSLHTVKNHVHNILEKLNVESRSEAVERAREENWLTHF